MYMGRFNIMVASIGITCSVFGILPKECQAPVFGGSLVILIGTFYDLLEALVRPKNMNLAAKSIHHQPAPAGLRPDPDAPDTDIPDE